VPSSSPASGRDARALAFGQVAATYEHGRPDWPVELLDAVPVPPGSDVLDLAAGTGKLTRLLATRHRVIAVEPEDAMRALIAGVEARAGTAEAIPLPDESVDAVFVGEAFHWFDGQRAVAEIERVLRPSGVVAIGFQRWDIDPALTAAAVSVLEEAEARFGPPGGPKVQSGEWKSAFPGPFEELRHVEIAHESPLDRDRIVALFASMSNVARQTDEVRTAFAAELLRAVPDERRTLVLTLDLYWTRLRDPASA
jgi:SAM-dependent methyltransferase